MDTRHVNAAVAVARWGSFTRAAQALFMAQSTVSRQVGALERELGVTLFLRGPRTVALTPHGEAFIREAEHVLAAVEQAERAAQKAC